MPSKKNADEKGSAAMPEKKLLQDDDLKQAAGGAADKKKIKEYPEYIISGDPVDKLNLPNL